MRKFRLCSKSHNAQYTNTKTKATPVRTDTTMQEMFVNSFLKRPTVVRLKQMRDRYIGADYNIIAVALHIASFEASRHLLLATALGENYKPTCDYIINNNV